MSLNTFTTPLYYDRSQEEAYLQHSEIMMTATTITEFIVFATFCWVQDKKQEVLGCAGSV